ncbi:hypothetical protein KJS94_16745 [Flavihumibacter rivuli]|uniref:DUF6580 family putative transport protein n=1 Tax=Flavihumibacter rivuli TaxID=2838156 RepID=UPI001BDE5444|nr:DUF6580 family putative transport protein [Flavihumibacter rivuli]ULQ56299.1 hypothetical protein KJS94_16745 [Flavihumibacter rivuli]
MKPVKSSPQLTYLLFFMAIVAAMRIPNAAQLTPLSNFTPIGAMALFGGAYLRPAWKAAFFPLLTLLVSDLVINLMVFNGQYGAMYSGWYWIYGAFTLIVLIGRVALKSIRPLHVLSGAIAGSLLYWMVVDLGVWLGGGTDLRTMQPFSRDWEGLMQCYLQGWPFMKNFLAGTVGYSAPLFGAMQAMTSKANKATDNKAEVNCA